MSFQEWAQIVGASVIGGLIATVGQFGLEWWRMRRERRYRHFDELTEIYREMFIISHQVSGMAGPLHPSLPARGDLGELLDELQTT